MKLTIGKLLRIVAIPAGLVVMIVAGPRTTHAVCGDGNVESNEQCDDGGTMAGDGCDATCLLDTVGRACKRAIGLQARILASNDLTLEQKCLDRVANSKIACQGGLCVLHPAKSPVTVTGSTCTVAADCCPSFDNQTPAPTTQAKIAKGEAKVAKAVKKACSLNVGPDLLKGTDDDTFVSPQIYGFASVCPGFDIVGACNGISATTLVSAGSDNDLIECSACIGREAALKSLLFHYPLAATAASDVKCQRAVGLQARKAEVYELTQRQKCLDKVSNSKLGCRANVCEINPFAVTPTVVTGSTCMFDGDCCPAFDNVNPTKTTQAKLATHAAVIAKAIKKGCSLDKGPDLIKGTDDDTFVDPQNLGYANSCSTVFGQCGSIATTDTDVAGTDNDMIDCVACTQSTVAGAVAQYHAP